MWHLAYAVQICVRFCVRVDLSTLDPYYCIIPGRRWNIDISLVGRYINCPVCVYLFMCGNRGRARGAWTPKRSSRCVYHWEHSLLKQRVFTLVSWQIFKNETPRMRASAFWVCGVCFLLQSAVQYTLLYSTFKPRLEWAARVLAETGVPHGFYFLPSHLFTWHASVL